MFISKSYQLKCTERPLHSPPSLCFAFETGFSVQPRLALNLQTSCLVLQSAVFLGTPSWRASETLSEEQTTLFYPHTSQNGLYSKCFQL